MSPLWEPARTIDFRDHSSRFFLVIEIAEHDLAAGDKYQAIFAQWPLLQRLRIDYPDAGSRQGACRHCRGILPCCTFQSVVSMASGMFTVATGVVSVAPYPS